MTSNQVNRELRKLVRANSADAPDEHEQPEFPFVWGQYLQVSRIEVFR
ncbi:hypothetical protein Plim_0835 [Planctopirus limnophila DSM 3776]|uniref:Uncharacterized protein n=1 Tax=Planctopirus limnophila (strain ATCC 43296 / DSM 3776 / IFAM 1008 / Mu 290) TaxID=521674 RepID=D5SSD2_PLAL2|nr:hypothetical protein Plim_0835 [Planctopirus limnophila DSM 3776]